MLKKKVKKEDKGMFKYIYCEVYKRGITVFIGNCASLRKWAPIVYGLDIEKDMIKTIEESCTDEEYINGDVAARCYDSDSGEWIVHIPKFSFTYDPKEISCLSHELLHAAFGMQDFIGIEYRYGGAHESYTYLHEYFLREALKEEGYTKVK